MTDIILSTQNGEPVASSRQIAESFEKRHDHVMRDIDTIKKDVPNFGEMFFLTMKKKIFMVENSVFIL